jgi:signal recognition particle receptor subunit beta
MVFFNWATMQMAAKIVYYGPGLCGKTSNLSYIYAKTTPNSRGEMVSLETESDRTLFFDLLPIEVGTIGGFKTRLQLYTVPGQVFYNTTRKLVLKGVDGLVFVADSQRPMREANTESFSSLVENLEDLGLDMADLPLVLQFNKRDLKNILTVEELNGDLNPHGTYAFHEASAINGDGVFETLKEITKLTLKKLRKRMASSQPGGVSPAASPVRPAMPAQRPESISAAALARAAEEGVVAENAPNPTPVAPGMTSKTSTTVAPPMPASPPPTADSDVFSAPDEAVHEPPADGPLDGAVELGSMEVTAPEVAAKAPDQDLDADIAEGEQVIVDDIEEPSQDWQSKTTEVSELDRRAGTDLGADPADHVDFDQRETEVAVEEPPPMKRVHVSNQLDILAELEGLRAGTLSGAAGRSKSSRSPDLDIDSLISGAMGGSKEIRRRIDRGVESAVFGRMHGVEFAITVKDAGGNEIHTLEPVVMEVEGAAELTTLAVKLRIDLKNNG